MTVYDSIADKKDMFDIKKTEGQFRLKSIKARYQELVKVNAPVFLKKSMFLRSGLYGYGLYG